MKPFWNAATPEWAEYLAQDKDGSWWWFEKEPRVHYEVWYTPAGRSCQANGNPNWKQTLEKRPEGLTSETR